MRTISEFFLFGAGLLSDSSTARFEATVIGKTLKRLAIFSIGAQCMQNKVKITNLKNNSDLGHETWAQCMLLQEFRTLPPNI